MRNFALTCSAMLLAITLVGCNDNTTTAPQSDIKPAGSSDTKTVATENLVCPLCQMKADAKVATTSFDGGTVGYCSDHCKESFEKMSDKEKKDLLAKSEKAHDHDHDHGDDHDHEKKEDKKES